MLNLSRLPDGVCSNKDKFWYAEFITKRKREIRLRFRLFYPHWKSLCYSLRRMLWTPEQISAWPKIKYLELPSASVLGRN